MSQKSTARSFDPISNEFSRILILGTMPSVKSREEGFYYVHPRNRFWQALATCFDQPKPLFIEEKTHFLLSNGVALWDVLQSCEVTASDDSSVFRLFE